MIARSGKNAMTVAEEEQAAMGMQGDGIKRSVKCRGLLNEFHMVYWILIRFPWYHLLEQTSSMYYYLLLFPFSSSAMSMSSFPY